MPTARTTERPLRKRRVRFLLAALAGLLIGVASVAMYTSRHLEAPWLRARLRMAVQQRLHLDLDYRAARLGLTGLEVRGLTLASMPVDRDLAPNLLHLETLTLRWQPGDLVRGQKRLRELHLSGLTLTVVVDSAGQTSLERVLAALPPTPEEPKTPFSHIFQAMSGEVHARLDDLQLRGVRARLLLRQSAGPPAEVRLGDLMLTGRMAMGAPQPVLELALDLSQLELALRSVAIAPAVVPWLATLPWLGPVATGTGTLHLAGMWRLQLETPQRLVVAGSVRTAGQSLFATQLSVDAEPRRQRLRLLVPRLAVAEWLTAHAEVELSDSGTVEVAQAAADLSLPLLHVPGLDLSALTAHVSVRDLAHRPAQAMPTWGGLEAAFDLGAAQVPGVALLRTHAEVSASSPEPGNAAGRVLLQVAGAAAQLAAADVTATTAELDAQFALLPDAITLTVTAPVTDLTLTRPDGTHLVLHDWRTHLALAAVGPMDLAALGPAALRSLTLQSTLATVHATLGGRSFAAVAPHLELTLPPVVVQPGGLAQGKVPLELALAVAELAAPGGVALRDLGLTARLLAGNYVAARPTESTGTLLADLRLGPLQSHLELHKEPTALAWTATWRVPEFAPLVAMLPLPPLLASAVNWSLLTLSGQSAGRFTLGAAPWLQQKTQLEVHDLTWQREVALHRLDLTLASEGTGLQQEASLDLLADIARLGPLHPTAPLALHGTLAHDPGASRSQLAVARTGPAGLDLALDLAAHAVGADLAYTLAAHVRGLATLLRWLPSVDAAALCLGDGKFAAEVAGKGLLTAGAGALGGGDPPTGDGRHAVSAAFGPLACRLPSATVSIRRVVAELEASGTAARRLLDLRVTVPQLDAAATGHAVHVETLKQHLALQLDGDSTIHVDGEGSLASLSQDALPDLAVAALTWAARGWSDAKGARLEQLEITNPASGTSLSLHGGLDRAAMQPQRVSDSDVDGTAQLSRESTLTAGGDERVPGRLGLGLTGELRQDLGVLFRSRANQASPGEFNGSGVVSVPFRVESGDWIVFRTEASLRFAHVDVALKQAGLRVRDVFGEVPLQETFAIAPTFQLLGGGEDDAYARWRFSEHQPFLRRSDFLSVGQIAWRGVEVGPIAGNASLDRAVFRLDQLEATLLHGQLTGQCLITLQGDDSHIQLRGNATGLQAAGSDERFDASAALDFLPLRRALEGRAEIRHVARSHLDALLDLWDPYREDAQSNRLRTLLKLGHPDHVRMRFDHGFLDLAVTLGGLGSLVQMSELRGIALGPMFQRWLDPILVPLRTPEAQEAPTQ